MNPTQIRPSKALLVLPFLVSACASSGPTPAVSTAPPSLTVPSPNLQARDSQFTPHCAENKALRGQFFCGETRASCRWVLLHAAKPALDAEGLPYSASPAECQPVTDVWVYEFRSPDRADQALKAVHRTQADCERAWAERRGVLTECRRAEEERGPRSDVR